MTLSLYDYVSIGLQAVFTAHPAFHVLGVPISMAVVMLVAGLLTGLIVGAIPALSGPFAMAVALPILISTFGFSAAALLPTLAFLLGVMKAATLGGSVPAILFNTPGTPDAYLTTFDGYPMARNGQAGKALRVAQFACVSGDTMSDMVLITTAPFLAVFVERYMGFPEKGALIILSMAFIGAAVGASAIKGLISAVFGLFLASIGRGDDQTPRLTFGIPDLANGFSVTVAVVGVLILGEVYQAIEDLAHQHRSKTSPSPVVDRGDQKLHWHERLALMPIIGRSGLIGITVGALPGIGSTLAATLGYAIQKRRHKGAVPMGQGAPEGIAATEAASAAVSGANLIPVLSLGIPGNVAAVFILIAIDTIGGLNPGPSVFTLNQHELNPELVMVIGVFVIMMLGNAINWTLGSMLMRRLGVLQHIPPRIMMPLVLVITVAAIYLQEGKMTSIYFALGFGVIGYLMRKMQMSGLPFVIAYILADDLERLLRQGFSASGADPWFLFSSPLAVAFLLASVVVAFTMSRNPIGKTIIKNADPE